MLERLRVPAAALILAVACVPDDPPEGARRRLRLSAAREAKGPLEPPRTKAPTPQDANQLADVPSADPELYQSFSDDFERSAIGPNYRTSSKSWRISEGRLCGTRAHNRPVWLARRLPVNARVEFDAISSSPDGDIKVELWGDGKSGATASSYTNATSYLAVFGGWKNSLHVLARLDEHGRDRKELRLDPEADDPRLYPVESERSYHFRIERRDGATLRWFVDDIEILSFTDGSPLAGPGHDHFGFNDWETPVCFDNLDILPLD